MLGFFPGGFTYPGAAALPAASAPAGTVFEGGGAATMAIDSVGGGALKMAAGSALT